MAVAKKAGKRCQLLHSIEARRECQSGTPAGAAPLTIKVIQTLVAESSTELRRLSRGGWPDHCRGGPTVTPGLDSWTIPGVRGLDQHSSIIESRYNFALTKLFAVILCVSYVVLRIPHSTTEERPWAGLNDCWGVQHVLPPKVRQSAPKSRGSAAATELPTPIS